MNTQKNDWYAEEYLDLSDILEQLCKRKVLHYDKDKYQKIVNPMELTDNEGHTYTYTRERQITLDASGIIVIASARYDLSSPEFSLHLECEKIHLRPKELIGQPFCVDDVRNKKWIDHKSFLHTHGEGNRVLNAILKYVHEKKFPENYD